MKHDPIMGWCVDARNVIVKEGDLDTQSIAKVALMNSHNEATENIFSVNPLLTGVEIAAFVKKKHLPIELSKYGYLMVERQWIAEDLKGVELLSALAHAFTVLMLLVNDIKLQIGPSSTYHSKKLNEVDFNQALDFLSDDDKPNCMLKFEEFRTTLYNLGTGELTNLSVTTIEFDKRNIPELKIKYGDLKKIGGYGKTLLDRVQFYLNISKKMYHI